MLEHCPLQIADRKQFSSFGLFSPLYFFIGLEDGVSGVLGLLVLCAAE